MGKPNTYVQLLNAKKEIAQLRHDIEFMKGFTLRQSLDMALVALNEAFNFGPERCQRFEQCFWDTFIEYARMCVSDGADDPEIVYTKEKLDKRVRLAAGEDYPDFDTRYDERNVYTRARDLYPAKEG